VGFRWSCHQEAERLGVSGWVRNEPDGSVLLVAEGEPEAVDALVDWCRTGPRFARVDEVSTSAREPSGARGFSVR